MSARKRMQSGVSNALMVACAAVLVFGGALRSEFVYDDAWTIVDNRWLERPLAELASLLMSGTAIERHVPDATRPAMVASLWLDRRLFATSASGFHLSSLLLYAINCGLVALLATRLTRKRLPGLVAAAFFAVAPIHAEPVVAINYREELLAGLGVLGAWLCLLGSPMRRGAGEGRELWKNAFGIAALWALALLAKESAVVLVLLLGVTWWILPRERRVLAARVRSLVALLVVGASWAAWRGALLLRGDDIPLAPQHSMTDTLLRTARYCAYSVRHGLFPWDWAPDRWRQPEPSALWMLPLAAVLALVVFLARRPRGRLFALGLSIAILAPLPASPIFRPVNELADRYYFLAVLGGGLIWGELLLALANRLRLRGRWRPLLVLACVPLALPATTAAAIWKTERTLWSAAVERTPASPRAWAALSRVHRMAGEHSAAAAAANRALAVDPEYAPALVTRIYNELAAGDSHQAQRHLEEVDRRGLGSYRGVSRARRCAALPQDDARACINR